MKDFFTEIYFFKKYEFRTPHALKMCFLSILIIFHTMLLSGMITNFDHDNYACMTVQLFCLETLSGLSFNLHVLGSFLHLI